MCSINSSIKIHAEPLCKAYSVMHSHVPQSRFITFCYYKKKWKYNEKPKVTEQQ